MQLHVLATSDHHNLYMKGCFNLMAALPRSEGTCPDTLSCGALVWGTETEISPCYVVQTAIVSYYVGALTQRPIVWGAIHIDAGLLY